MLQYALNCTHLCSSTKQRKQSSTWQDRCLLECTSRHTTSAESFQCRVSEYFVRKFSTRTENETPRTFKNAILSKQEAAGGGTLLCGLLGAEIITSTDFFLFCIKLLIITQSSICRKSYAQERAFNSNINR